MQTSPPEDAITEPAAPDRVRVPVTFSCDTPVMSQRTATPPSLARGRTVRASSAAPRRVVSEAPSLASHPPLMDLREPREEPTWAFGLTLAAVLAGAAVASLLISLL